MGTVTELEAKNVLAEHGIPVITEQHATTKNEAVTAADEIGYPVFLKVDGKNIQHKTDIGAVKEADSPEAVKKMYEEIMENTLQHYDEEDIAGVLVEEKATGIELILGVNKDETFGHVLMFGLGGIFVEVLEDVHFRALPVTEQDARELLEEMRSKKILDGVRGMPPVNRDALVETMLKMNTVVETRPEITSLDINPLFADENGVVAVDALLEVEEE